MRRSALVEYFLQEVNETCRVWNGSNDESTYPRDVLDERMIVYSFVCADRSTYAGDARQYDDAFFKLLFVDQAEDALPDLTFRRRLLRQQEYTRWKQYQSEGGTREPTSHMQRYGFSRYSAVVMGTDDRFFEEYVFSHFKSMYYDQALILLFLRAALLQFSTELSSVKSLLSDRARIADLRQRITDFTNRYWFIELTNFDQGVEMFDQWSAILRNRQLFDEVHRQLTEVDDLLARRDAEQLNRAVWLLTFLGLLGIVITMGINYLAMLGSLSGTTQAPWTFAWWPIPRDTTVQVLAWIGLSYGALLGIVLAIFAARKLVRGTGSIWTIPLALGRWLRRAISSMGWYRRAR